MNRIHTEPDFNPPEKSHYELLRFCRRNKTDTSLIQNLSTLVPKFKAPLPNQSVFKYPYIMHNPEFQKENRRLNQQACSKNGEI